MILNTTTHHVSSSSQLKKADSHLRPRYLGMWGTLTGALSVNPQVFHNRDGSRTYLFRMDVESRTGNPNNDQLNQKVSLVAYVPAGHTDYCAGLGRGDCVKVRYVVQTDYYLDREGRPTKRTCLSARGVYPLSREAQSAPGQVQSPPPSAPQYGRRPVPSRPRPNRQDSGMERGRA